ncbi:MAG: hypothetical protein PHG08_03695 [Bacilli bacterium]|jgi:tRNA nucleotidyltransferase (CCA-adding enzyme)|nr:hypothetical protein [Bacilli bacterium]HHU24191.1 hypothetical protein [Acholeplasmataceae bacterium]
MDQNAYFEKGLAIVRRLNECTYEAYLVGGIVRDHLMHMPFTDIDIATNATPEQILEVFPDASTEYMTMGTMSVRLDGFKFEIATFRSEVYTVSRKPTEIHYSQKLQDDIMRRDFTINGMAMSASQNIIDFCGGRKDLQKGIIRTIGKPKKSFREDPLRILRAFSLMARFNFKLAKATQKSIKQTKKYLIEISEYKASAELRKIFEAPYGKKTLKKIKKMGLLSNLKPYGEGISYLIKRFATLSTLEKMAICFKRSGSFPTIHALTHQEMKDVQSLVALSNELEMSDATPLMIYHFGVDKLRQADLINVLLLKRYKSKAKQIAKVQKQTVFITTSQMAFKAQHLIELTGGSTGPFVGEIIESLKEQIISGIIPNEFEVLKAEALRQYEIIKQKPKSKEKVKYTPVGTEKTAEFDTELYNQYKREFALRYEENIALIHDFDKKTKAEQEAIKKQVREAVHSLLVKQKPEYKKFEVN